MVSKTRTEGKKVGALDFFAGGGINMELRLGDVEEDLHPST